MMIVTFLIILQTFVLFELIEFYVFIKMIDEVLNLINYLNYPRFLCFNDCVRCHSFMALLFVILYQKFFLISVCFFYIFLYIKS